MDPVISDDDVAARAQLCLSNPSGIDAKAREPTWAGLIQMGSDPGHCTKILTNPLYAASINPKTIAYVKKSFGYAINQGHGDTLETLKGRMIFAENHMCGLHTTCEEYFPGNCHALHQEQGKAHKPALP